MLIVILPLHLGYTMNIIFWSKITPKWGKSSITINKPKGYYHLSDESIKSHLKGDVKRGGEGFSLRLDVSVIKYRRGPVGKVEIVFPDGCHAYQESSVMLRYGQYRQVLYLLPLLHKYKGKGGDTTSIF